jgi:S1-C subfamily serine protease
MTRLIWILIFSIFSCASFAGEDFGEDIDAQLKAAREKLDAAARELAELHKTQFGMGDDKAMLGILLGEGPPVGGIELVGVTPGGGAEAAGLKTGDIIVRIGDAALDKADDPMRALVDYMKQIKPGEQVEVRYRRGDKTDKARIVTEAHSLHMLKIIRDKEPLVAVELEHLLDRRGHPERVVLRQVLNSDQLMYVEGGLAGYFDVDSGVVVTDVREDSQLRGGDVLLTIAGEDVHDLDAAVTALSDLKAPLDVTVKRKGKVRRLKVQPGDFTGENAQGAGSKE